MSEHPVVVNVADADEKRWMTDSWGAAYKVLTPSMRPRGGSLGVNQNTLSPGHATCPFHWHLREDEVFYVLSGFGVLRYGDALIDLKPGDCVSCPAGTKVAHQIANPYDEDLVYLAIGSHDPHEVCGYPDNGKVLVRGAGGIGFLKKAEYMEGEPDVPGVFDLIRNRGS